MNRREFIAVGTAAMLPWQDDAFVVHEWGVLTVPHGATWANLRTGSGEKPALPAFAVEWTAAVGKLIEEWKERPIIIDKPVVHFYSKRKRTVDVRVAIPTGRPKAWFPPASDFGPRPALPEGRALMFKEKGDTKIEDVKPVNGFVQWKNLEIDPEAAGFAETDGWWATARKIESTPVRMGDARDRFLFYEALAPYRAAPELGWVDGVPRCEGALGIRVRDGKAAGATAEDLTRALTTAGLFADEARRVVEIWEPEFFGADGARVLKLMPREELDALLPLSITPAPDSLVRAMIVHIECLTPERLAEVDALIGRLGSEDAGERDAAMEELRKHGPWAEGRLRAAREKTRDFEVRARIDTVLKELRP
jgi:hypothetical protein